MATPTTGALVASGSGPSMADMLTTLKNVVTAVNTLATTWSNIQGIATSGSLSAATVVKGEAGRLCSVSVTTAGAVGTIYDTANVASTSNPIYIVPAVLGVYVVNLPIAFGIVYVPGSAQVATISYS
jgi:hypothetical protein